MRVRRWALLAVVALAAALFAYFNAGERVSVHFGFASVYRVSMPRLVLGSFLLGMLVMWGIGLRHDLRVRRTLLAHGLEDAEEEAQDPVEDLRHEHV